MCLFAKMKVACPACGSEAEVNVVGSINADRRPDLRQKILNGDFQAVTCAECGAQFRLPPSFTYIDFGRNQWILAHPAFERHDWREFEQIARDIFNTAHGPHAPVIAQELGREITPKITFGWPALCEKLVCAEQNLDDVTLELVKLAVLRNVPNPPFSDTAELRLRAVEDDTLLFGWIEDESELSVTSLRVPRAVYDGLAGSSAWDPIRAELGSHIFADIACLLVA
jgi:hypothetical protein